MNHNNSKPRSRIDGIFFSDTEFDTDHVRTSNIVRFESRPDTWPTGSRVRLGRGRAYELGNQHFDRFYIIQKSQRVPIYGGTNLPTDRRTHPLFESRLDIELNQGFKELETKYMKPTTNRSIVSYDFLTASILRSA